MNNYNPRLLVVDNYDSFTFNLVQIIQEYKECDFDIVKNDKVDIKHAMRYDGFLFSPGPGTPNEAPSMTWLLKEYQDRKSFLGICLGHQAIAETYGMRIMRLDTVRHGIEATIRVIDPTDYLFRGMPSSFKAGLYHSWAVCTENEKIQPDATLRVTAVSNDRVIMAISHTEYDIKGVQFHPESHLSQGCCTVIHNWIDNLAVRKSKMN